MKELVTLPQSIRQKLEEAATLEAANKPREADDALRAAAVELARTRPEICALLIAAAGGYRELSSVEHHSWTTYQVLSRYFLGIKTGESVVPLTNEHRIEKRWRLS